MTKQAALGPIDPGLTHPLSPRAPSSPNQPIHVQATAIEGYLDLAENLGIKTPENLTTLLTQLSQQVHPLILGQATRALEEARTLADILLGSEKVAADKKEALIDFLCGKAGSHQRTIDRREAKQLGLPIENPSSKLYELISKLYEDLVKTMKLREKFDLALILGSEQIKQFCWEKVVLESAAHGSTKYCTKGDVVRFEQQQTLPNRTISNLPTPGLNVNFEGWEHLDW